MLAATHVMIGVASWAASAATIADAVGVDPTPSAVTLGVVAAAGGALMPDLDTPTSTISRSAGIITTVASKVAGKVSGGHRGGFHSLFAVALFALLTVPAGPVGTVRAVIVGLAAWMVASMPTRGRRRLRGAVRVVATVAAAGIAHQAGDSWWVVAAAVGWASHVAADLLTPRGVPLLWPATARRVAVPLVVTGGVVEVVVGLVAATAMVLTTGRALLT